MNQFPVGFFTMGPPEMLMILVVGLLVFGKRLPEVGRTFGKTFMKFREEMKTIEEDIVGSVGEEPTESERD